ncbi:hypothetical protein ACHAQH_002684 [Verticillium albo-atrum]
MLRDGDFEALRRVLALFGVAACTLGLLHLIRRLFISPSSPRTSWHTAAPPRQMRAGTSEKQLYADVFPPIENDSLSGVAAGCANLKAVNLNLSLGTTARHLVPLDADYRKCDPASFNYSGFRFADICALGDFPDYAKLSGVPLPSPLLDFDVDRAPPRPYRPFRWSYHQTMSLSKMDKDFWIELESTYRARIAERKSLFATHGVDVLDRLPGSELACKELMEMVLQFLCARYPNKFAVEGGVVLRNGILDTSTDLAAMHPLEVLLDNVPEDFGIMIRDPETGLYVLRAGIICSSVGWKLSEKMGLGLPGIHAVVPDYKEKMELSMDRFFAKMPASKPIQRGSWGLEASQPLFLPADAADFAHRSTQDPKLTAENVYLRVDWQTLRRLPLSGAIVFNFKALFTPLTELRDEAYVPSLVLKVLDEGKESILRYKGTWHVEHVAKPALREFARFQVEEGMVERDWSVQTLAEAPFFRGWERKWRAADDGEVDAA